MAFLEKSNWVVLLISPIVLVIYLAQILPLATSRPIPEVDFAGTMVGNIVLFVVANIVGNIVAAITNPAEADKKDQRDREIDRFGERIGNWILIAGACVALVLAMGRQDGFWIANAIYLAGIAAAIASASTKIVAYHGPFQRW